MCAVIAVKSILQQKHTHNFIDPFTVYANVVSTVVTQHNGEEGTTRKAPDAAQTDVMHEIYYSVCRGN